MECEICKAKKVDRKLWQNSLKKYVLFCSEKCLEDYYFLKYGKKYGKTKLKLVKELAI